MKLSEGVEWAVHCCLILAIIPQGKTLPKAKLAEFFDLKEHYLAKIMQSLSRANIVESQRGNHGGYSLAKAPSAISLLDVVQAVEGPASFFRCTEIRQCGPSAVAPRHYPKPCGIAQSFWRAESLWREELARTSLIDLAQSGAAEIAPEQIRKTGDWLQAAYA